MIVCIFTRLRRLLLRDQYFHAKIMTQAGADGRSVSDGLTSKLESLSFPDALAAISECVEKKGLDFVEASAALLYIRRNLEQVHSKQAENVEKTICNLCRIDVPVLKLGLLSCSDCGSTRERIGLFAAHVLKKLNIMCIKLQESDAVMSPRPLFDGKMLEQLGARGVHVDACDNAAKAYSENVLKLACRDDRVGQYVQKHLTELTVCVDKA